MLVGVIVMVVLVMIALSVAAPVVAKDLRREKEIESQHRAQQYVRAIRLYYRKTHNYPGNVDALKNTNNIRFLRQEYVDPLTGKNDWRLIHLGEQKTTIKGFFGQELGGLNSSGLGSAAGMASGTGTPIGGGASVGGTTTPLNQTFSGTSSPTGSGGLGTGGGTSGLGATGIGSSGLSGSSGSSGSTGLGSGLGGGGAIVGVGTARSGNSITTPNQQATYETWEFWYDPRIETLYQKGITNSGIGSGTGNSQSPSTFGSPIGGSPGGIGTSSPFSNSPTTTPSSGTTNSHP